MMPFKSPEKEKTMKKFLNLLIFYSLHFDVNFFGVPLTCHEMTKNLQKGLRQL